jgi:hypothetical protein
MSQIREREGDASYSFSFCEFKLIDGGDREPERIDYLIIALIYKPRCKGAGGNFVSLFLRGVISGVFVEGYFRHMPL